MRVQSTILSCIASSAMVSIVLLLMATGCGAPQAPRAHGNAEAEREANRRALEQVVSRSREQTHPMDVVRSQLEAGWLARHWLVDLSPRDVLQEVGLAPSSDSETVCSIGEVQPTICFRVVQVSPAARRLREHGLMVDDVLVHVNGRTIERPEDLSHLFEEMAEADELHVAILRDGEPVLLRADIRDE